MELNKLKAKYNVLSTNKATKSLMRLKQSYYEQGERAGKLLAWRIKQMQAERAINSILTDKGDTTSDPKEINDTFQCIYQNLYGSEYSEYTLNTLNTSLQSAGEEAGTGLTSNGPFGPEWICTG